MKTAIEIIRFTDSFFHTNHETGETIEQYAKRMVELHCHIKAQVRVTTLHAEPMGIFNCNYQPRDGEIIVDAEWSEVK